MRAGDEEDDQRQGGGGSVVLPRDEFSVRLRELQHHPGAVKASSRIDIPDFYGNVQTWTIDTFRHDKGEVGFIQRMGAGSGFRETFPEKIMAALVRHHDTMTRHNRKKGARAALATRRARGDTLGNKAGLEAARKARMAKARLKKEEKE